MLSHVLLFSSASSPHLSSVMFKFGELRFS
jgi:hypothetical protein